MLSGVPGNLENRAGTLKFFSGPISEPEFAADFFKHFCTFRHFGVRVGTPFGSLWLENGALEKGSKKRQKKVIRGVASKYVMDLLAPKEEALRPPSSYACRIWH